MAVNERSERAGQPAPRVWDRFLTEQDRALLGTRTPRRRGFGHRPALLLIDLYRGVFGDSPEPVLEAVKTWPSSCGLAGWNSIPHLQRLLAAAREAGIPIIHTRGGGDENIAKWSRPAPSDVSDPTAADRRRRHYDIIDEVAPLPGELVIRKESPSAFWGTPLLGHLIANGIDTILVGGESTSGCVRGAVVDGCTNRFKMAVVEECVFDRTESTHAMELFTMNRKYADVIALEEAISYLSDLPPAAAQRGRFPEPRPDAAWSSEP
jgi:maleamate amidohydrolase